MEEGIEMEFLICFFLLYVVWEDRVKIHRKSKYR